MQFEPKNADLTARKAYLINNIFLEQADFDYITARWAYSKSIFNVFYWSSAQAIEKYSKACLLYSDMTTRKFNHDIVKLYKKLTEIDSSGRIAREIKTPKTSGLNSGQWDGKPALEFLAHLSVYGSTDNRYGLTGTYINSPIIHVVDQICFSLRSSIKHRKLYRKSQLKSEFHHAGEEKIQAEDWMLNWELPLEDINPKNQAHHLPKDLYDVFRNMNFSYPVERSETESTFGGLWLNGSPLFNQLVRWPQIDQSPENIEISQKLKDWALCNIDIGKDIIIEIESHGRQ